MATEFVTNEVRDEAINALLYLPDNKKCFDCGSKNPKWCSSNIGIFLCYQCTSKHRNMGVHISFVRSLKMDRWKRKELKCMELGGNKNARDYFEANGMFKDGKPDHEAAPHSRWKQELSMKAEAACKAEMPQQQYQQVQAVGAILGQYPAPAQPDMTKGLQANPFDMGIAPTINTYPEMEPKPIYQAYMQSVSVPTAAPSKNAMQLGKKINNLQQVQTSSGGGMTFARKQDNGAVKSLNAKKLDIDFGGDDFFNSFYPAQKEETNIFGNGYGGEKKQSSKLQEVDSLWGNDLNNQDAGSSSSNQMSINLGGNDMYASQMQEEAARAKLATMGNRKAISSADFVDQEEQSQEIKDKFRALYMSGATQISSDMMFGNAQQPDTQQQASLSDMFTNNLMGRSESKYSSQPANEICVGGSLSDRSANYEEYKAKAAQVAGRVGEKASEFKAAASDWFSQFTAKE